jgi:acetyltransferase-like isoleucine patch superfamily enzyme
VGTSGSDAGRYLRRFLVPAPIVTLLGWLRWRARISMRAEVELSENLRLGERTTISSFTKVKTADGPVRTGIRIGNNVWIGANCTILDGSVIGDNTIIVANSLVNRRLPPNVIVQGNPAKVVLQRRGEAPVRAGEGP